MKNEIQTHWAAYVNNPLNKPYKDSYGTKHQHIKAIDFAIYNVVRKLPIVRGFVQGSDTMNRVVWQLQTNLKYKHFSSLLSIYNGNVDETQFMGELDEAIRLHRNS